MSACCLSWPRDTYDSAQIRIEGGRGITCCANNLQVGRDDGRQGTWSPSFGIVYQDLEDCVISNNVLHKGALQKLLQKVQGTFSDGKLTCKLPPIDKGAVVWV